ncbi:hypothetical protein OL548_14720 [Lysinibacillus sp. MHQ-1]|nr:hypothetical protein OL548_14720 [Lysinibacillus sp. MHQ-1]
MRKSIYRLFKKKETYEIQQPAKFNIARGSIIKNMNNALNMNEIERGLMELSVNHFFHREVLYAGRSIFKW